MRDWPYTEHSIGGKWLGLGLVVTLRLKARECQIITFFEYKVLGRKLFVAEIAGIKSSVPKKGAYNKCTGS